MTKRAVVLNVDDYDAGRYATSRVLQQAGFEVLEAETGNRAIELAREQPDVVILDINLPDISGFEVCRILKDDPSTSHIPILQMSASAVSTDQRVRGLEGGADAYVTQPVDPRELIATVEALLRMHASEEEVRRSEQRFRSLVDATSELVLTTQPDGTLTQDVPHWRDITGQSETQMLGTGWSDAIHEEDRARFLSAWQKALRTGDMLFEEFRLRVKDGSYRYYSARAVPVRDRQGDVTEGVAIFIDIDEARRLRDAQQYITEATALLSSSLDYETTLRRVAEMAVPALADMATVDLVAEDGRIERVAIAHADPKMLSLVEELKENYQANPNAPGGFHEVLRRGAAILRPHVTQDMLERAATAPEHLAILQRLQLTSYVSVPLIARGTPLGVLTFLTAGSGRVFDERDVTLFEELGRRAAMAVDNARLYDAALDASKAKGDFLAVMSHELRTPMNAIIGYADLLDAEVAGPLTDSQRMQLGRVNASAHHLLTIIDQVLTFSRLEAGMEPNDLEEIDAVAAVREAADLIVPLAEKKGLEFRINLPDDAVRIKTNSGKLRQIVLNLLSNAVKFTDSGSVELSVARNPNGIQLQVRDSGIGISKDNLDRIFDPFWQVEQTTSRKVGGSGLGLGVTRSLALLLGGDVAVVSVVGEGSTFTVTLPFVAQPIVGREGN